MGASSSGSGSVSSASLSASELKKDLFSSSSSSSFISHSLEGKEKKSISEMLREFSIAQQNLSENIEKELKQGKFKSQQEAETFQEQELERISREFEKTYTLPLSQSQRGRGGRRRDAGS